MNCDRHTVTVPKSQVGFIKFLVQPLWVGLSDFLPELRDTALRNLDANLAHFSAQIPP